MTTRPKVFLCVAGFALLIGSMGAWAAEKAVPGQTEKTAQAVKSELAIPNAATVDHSVRVKDVALPDKLGKWSSGYYFCETNEDCGQNETCCTRADGSKVCASACPAD